MPREVSQQTGVRVIAVIQIAVTCIITISVLQSLQSGAISDSWIFVGLYLFIPCFLLAGANQRNRWMCMIWLVINTAGHIVNVIAALRYFFKSESLDIFVILTWIVTWLLQWYFLSVVSSFMTELKKDEESTNESAVCSISTYHHQPPRESSIECTLYREDTV